MSAGRGGFRAWMLFPGLIAFALVSVMLRQLLTSDPNHGQDLPSPLIDKPAPQFALGPLFEGQPGLSTADLTAPGVKLVNIWASWCGPCRIEHPRLMAMSAAGVTIHSINYKDQPSEAKGFLAEVGNPFKLTGADTTGRVAIDWGVYGVPETFVIDGHGRIVYKHIGPIQGSDYETKIRPAIDAAAQR